MELYIWTQVVTASAARTWQGSLSATEKHRGFQHMRAAADVHLQACECRKQGCGEDKEELVSQQRRHLGCSLLQGHNESLAQVKTADELLG